jgi:HD-like signal output (HDOD) protein
VLELSDDPECSVKDLVKVMRLDQGITFRVLRLCNSAYFGLPRKISTLEEALVFLGNNTLVNFIVTSITADFLQGSIQGYGLGRGEMWRHGVASALGADIIGKRVMSGDIGLLFTAALIHDIGKVILNEHVLTELERIRGMVQEEKCSFYEAEKKILGFSHADVGGQVAAAWNLPPVLVNAILYHHEPAKACEGEDEVAVVHLANNLALTIGYGIGSDGLNAHFDSGALERFGLTAEDLMACSAELHTAFKGAVDLIQLHT